MTRFRGSLLVITGAAVMAAGCSHNPAPAAATADPGVARDLAIVRAATKAFSDTAVAHAAGYPTTNTPPCLADSTMGGMGQHFVNRALVDDKVELEHPEILLYSQQPGGKVKLVAVEYIIPYRLVPRDSTAPRIFGRAMLQNDPLKLWNLHVWAYEENPSGLFAEWNPAVKCGAHKGM